MPLRQTFFFLLILFTWSCNNKKEAVKEKAKSALAKPHSLIVDQPSTIPTPKGMIWVKGKRFLMGAKENDPYALSREKPAHEVEVDGFFMDITEVTNAQFKAFVDATGYVTVAERPVDWNEMKKQLPKGTPKPPDSILQPGCMIFNKNVNQIDSMDNYEQWWSWKVGVNWKHPEGKGSSIEGKDNYPVVHIAYEDAVAYCKWANRRLPTEAEWESAAQGSYQDKIFTWGNDLTQLNAHANTWQGKFPLENKPKDGYAFIAPVGSYPPNSIGLYDMIGNVWELTTDWFNVNYYSNLRPYTVSVNPQGADEPYNPNNPYQKERIIKGGSFLCHDSYCASFRISSRMAVSLDSGADHVGFRTVATADMIQREL
ncbi:formylglycine-generating enzyme family protein [Flavobacteriaceae bacterium F08102]|nr:formylglycine-generating enzyme family protein [Flavobacteriaceae bacterium F08102]